MRNVRAGAAEMRLRQANNGREMYQLVADENDSSTGRYGIHSTAQCPAYAW